MTLETFSVDEVFSLLGLLEDGRSHALGDLCTHLGVRSIDTVHLQRQADGLGAQLELLDEAAAVRWRNHCVLLNHETIVTRVDSARLDGFSGVEILKTIDSTNRYLMELGLRRSAHGYCCLAETQSAGRGRRGNTWRSPLGNIYLSVGWETGRAPLGLNGLSLAIGVAVAEVLEECGAEVALKWPNDVLHDGRKLAGILIETQRLSSAKTLVVVGVGVNVRRTPLDAASPEWTDLTQVLEQDVDRSRVAGDLICAMLKTLHGFELAGFDPFAERWNTRHAMRGRRVTLMDRGVQIVGRALDVDDQGAFRMEVDGEIRVINAGSFALRLLE